MIIKESEIAELSSEDAATLYIAERERRLDLEKVVNDMKGNESLLKAKLIKELSEQGTLVQGRAIQVVTKSRPTITNYEEIRQYVVDTGNIQVFNRALNKANIQALGDVPGVQDYDYSDISVRKIR